MDVQCCLHIKVTYVYYLNSLEYVTCTFNFYFITLKLITFFSLSENNITDEGAIAISVALKNMTSLQIMESMYTNNNKTVIYYFFMQFSLGRNKIGAKGIVCSDYRCNVIHDIV